LHGENAAIVPPFLAPVDSPLPADPLPDPMPLAALLRFFRNPTEDLLARRLKLDLSALEEKAFSDSEPLDETFGAIHVVARDVFFRDALPLGFDDEGPRWSGKGIPDRIAYSGLMPPGDLGVRAWKHEAEAVTALLHAVRPSLPSGMQETNVAIDVHVPAPHGYPDVEGIRIQGTLRNVFCNEQAPQEGYRLVRAFTNAPKLKVAAELDFGYRLKLFIEWAALRLHVINSDDGGVSPRPVQLLVLAERVEGLSLVGELQNWDQAYANHPNERQAMADDLRQRLGALVGLVGQASNKPPLYFPKTSFKAYEAFLKKGVDDARKKAIASFEKGFNSLGVRNYSPGWTRLYANGVGFDPRHYPNADTDLGTLLDYAADLANLMTLTIPEAPVHG